jgi:iron-sulfur cluster assembly accessory protein
MGINNIEEQDASLEKAQSDFKDAQIFVSEKAVKRLKAVMSSEGKGDYFLRMSVDSGGCSGMNYKMDFDEHQDTFDKVFNQNPFYSSYLNNHHYQQTFLKNNRLCLPKTSLLSVSLPLFLKQH